VECDGGTALLFLNMTTSLELFVPNSVTVALASSKYECPGTSVIDVLKCNKSYANSSEYCSGLMFKYNFLSPTRNSDLDNSKHKSFVGSITHDSP
jgi:hypothetical protein